MTERASTVDAAADFDAFYRAHRDRLYRALALTTGRPDVAQESVDEALARAAERWETIAHYRQPDAWAYRVALNCARSTFRRRARFWRHAPRDRVDDRLPDPEVNRAVRKLPPKLRLVVVARYYLDWPLETIANALDLPTGTVKSRLSRALAALRRELEDHR